MKSSSVRTTETLIREFFLALANGNEIHADSIIEELKAGGRLSAENLVFLEIEKLGAFQYWGALTSHSQLTYLKSMRRPRNVTVLLLEAFWRIELADFAEKGDVEGIIEYYRSDFDRVIKIS